MLYGVTFGKIGPDGDEVGTCSEFILLFVRIVLSATGHPYTRFVFGPVISTTLFILLLRCGLDVQRVAEQELSPSSD